MIGTEHLARVLARPPVNVEVMGIDPDTHPDDYTDEQRDNVYTALCIFWASEGVNWPDVTEVARQFAHKSQRELFADIPLTIEDHDTVEDALTLKLLFGFTTGWMLARGMGNSEESEE